MSILYYAKAALVNESLSHIERWAVKITQVAKSHYGFIKTFPFVDYRNRSVMQLIRNEMPPYKRAAYLGISFTSYNCMNYIEFYSAFNDFNLKKNDAIELHFEDSDVINCSFNTNGVQQGPIKKNVFPISDEQLEYIANKKLIYWKLFDNIRKNVLEGGFEHQEDNEQYKSENTGRQLLKTMAKEMIAKKLMLESHIRNIC